MKKLMTMALALVLVLGIAGCSDSDPVVDDDTEVAEVILGGTVWQNGDEYTGFGYDNTVVVWDSNGYEVRVGTYEWDGENGSITYDNEEVVYLASFEDDPMLSTKLSVDGDEEGVVQYMFCEEIPDFLKGNGDDPDPDNGGSSQVGGGNELPESLRPTFTGGLEVTESRIGENRGGYLADLGETSWMIGDDIYTFFSDGYVDALNMLVGETALGTYNVEENGDVICLMDNGAELTMSYVGEEKLSLDGKAMNEVAYSSERYSAHTYSGPGSVVGSAWVDRDTDEEFCFLANDVVMLYSRSTQAVVTGSSQWNDDGTAVIKVDGNSYKVKLENGYLYTETPYGMEPLPPVHQEDLSYEFLGMERVLYGTWEWTENPTITLEVILTGISNTYDNEKGYGTIYADQMMYDGETLTTIWPENDGLFNGTVTGQILGDGSLALDGWDGWFVRVN